MSDAQLTSVLFLVLLLVGFAQLLGYLFTKMRQPKVVGEILAGVLFGNALLGRMPVVAHFVDHVTHQGNILDFLYWLGLLLLMFLAGAETQQLFTREERREVGWLIIVGTGLPFVLGLLFAPWLIHPSLEGPNGNRLSLTIILAIGVAVTSVPVVSKIFADLKILHTRFARLVLGVAVIEDIALWFALAIATAAAGTAVLHPRQMSYHLLSTVGFFMLGMTLLPRAIKKFNKARFNVLARYSPPHIPLLFFSPIVWWQGLLASAWYLQLSSLGLLWSTKNADCLPKRSTPLGRCLSHSSFRFILRLSD